MKSFVGCPNTTGINEIIQYVVVPSIIIIWRNLVWAVHLGVECSSRPRKSGMIVRLSQFYIGIYRDIRAFRPYQLLSMQLEHYSTYIPVLYLFWFCILCCCNTVLIKLPGVLMRIRYKKNNVQNQIINTRWGNAR